MDPKWIRSMFSDSLKQSPKPKDPEYESLAVNPDVDSAVKDVGYYERVVAPIFGFDLKEDLPLTPLQMIALNEQGGLSKKVNLRQVTSQDSSRAEKLYKDEKEKADYLEQYNAFDDYDRSSRTGRARGVLQQEENTLIDSVRYLYNNPQILDQVVRVGRILKDEFGDNTQISQLEDLKKNLDSIRMQREAKEQYKEEKDFFNSRKQSQIKSEDQEIYDMISLDKQALLEDVGRKLNDTVTVQYSPFMDVVARLASINMNPIRKDAYMSAASQKINTQKYIDNLMEIQKPGEAYTLKNNEAYIKRFYKNTSGQKKE